MADSEKVIYEKSTLMMNGDINIEKFGTSWPLVKDKPDISDIWPDGAGAHNSLFRGKCFGQFDNISKIEFNDKQIEAIVDGTYKDLFIGDYFTINATRYDSTYIETNLVIAGFDFDTFDNNVIFVPDMILRESALSDINLSYILDEFNDMFFKYDDWMDETGFKISSSLMTEIEIFGSEKLSWCYGPSTHSDYRQQFPLFRLCPSYIKAYDVYWLNSYISETEALTIQHTGYIESLDITFVKGIRPYIKLTRNNRPE